MDIKTLNAWQEVGIFPAHLLALVGTLTTDQIKPSSRQRWTDDEYADLQVLVDEGKRDREIAKILAQQFGRRLVETSITNARRRMFRNAGT